ncbi:Rv1733c family protein [Rhodococcus sp. NPDC003322]
MWRDAFGYAALTRRSLRRGHDPLRRRFDRLEGLLAVGVILLAVVLIPLSVWLGNLAGDSQSALAEQQARDYRQVTATTVADATTRSLPTDGVPVSADSAPARWVAAGGEHRAEVSVDPGARAGTELTIWVDGDGNLSGAPITATAATTGGIIVGLFTWTSTMLIAACGFLGARAALNRYREREWSRQISAFLGSATSH